MKRMNTKANKNSSFRSHALCRHKHFKGDSNVRPRREAKKYIEQEVGTMKMTSYALKESEKVKDHALAMSEIITLIKSMINSKIEQFTSDENKTTLSLSNPLDGVSKRRLAALGFEVENLCATYTGNLTGCINLLAQKVSDKMNTQITETQLDNATHALALTLQNMGITLGDEIKCNLNDTISSFLYENVSVDVVSDEEVHDESKVQICKTRNVSCNANEEITYEIDKVTWKSAVAEHDGDEEQALLHLQTENKVVRLDYDSEIQEISEEFDVNIEEV